ncbi:hypothetical protein FB45DRAFT_55530 [Roridomyces roridus]|uniref:DUF5648 domain-containing protein n=1 Tax=Roridomyces roridus TaxID=1738132 RepID=A0AAD7FIU5_9AGAR|nr:hypothetical protein FB45DRAFT_55530 [Roridomyces roridus]
MRSMFPLLFVSILLWSISSKASGVMQNLQARTCGNANDSVPLFATNGGPLQDFFASTSTVAIASVIEHQGFTFLGVSARVFTTQEPSTTPLYLVYSVISNGDATDHFYTTSASDRALLIESGWIDAGVQAYIYPTQICGSVPYYVVYNSAQTEHFYTANQTQYQNFLATAGWADQGIVGYVLPDPPNCIG